MKKSKENILITRPLDEKSPLRQLSKDGHKLIAQSFLNLTPQKVEHIPEADIYFYYSKNGVKYFIEAAKSLNKDLTVVKHAAMGSGTAEVLNNFGLQVDFIGSNTPLEVAKQLVSKYEKEEVCFVRANQSTQSIQKLWPSKYSQLVVYNIIPKIFSIKDEIHTILATSPMNLVAALESCKTNALKRIICIGPTTYAAAQKAIDVDCYMAQESNEVSMLEAYYN